MNHADLEVAGVTVGAIDLDEVTQLESINRGRRRRSLEEFEDLED